MALFVDMKKAFDTVDHKILMCKLNRLGLHRDTVDWFSSYLSNRIQTTFVNRKCSNRADVTYGVPQGSILGPLLYLMYVNDIQNVFSQCTVAAENPVDAYLLVQNELGAFSEWCTQNKLTVNINKTKAMLFGSRHTIKNAQIPHLKFNGNLEHYVKEYTYLGAHLDNLLDFEAHAKATLKIASHKIKILSKIRMYLTETQALTIYKQKVLPYFDYGDVLYIGSYRRTLRKLQRQQNRALRKCLRHDKRCKTNPLHVESKVALLDDRRRLTS